MSTAPLPSPIPSAPPSGLWSTEFWYAVVLTVGGLGVAFHLIPAGDADTLTAQLKTVVGAALGLAATIVPIWKYISARVQTKQNQLNAAAQVQQALTLKG